MNESEVSPAVPEQFPVAVLMKRRPAPSERPWMGRTWRILGVVASSAAQESEVGGLRRVRQSEDGEDFIWSGLEMRLFKDEAESYYYNLMAKNPSVFVITTPDERGAPQPLLVSASFDEAHAYLEAEGDAEAVSMPPEIYQWVERFVIRHYVPERRVKRKRRNWSEDSHGAS
jgi:hypothetical protein